MDKQNDITNESIISREIESNTHIWEKVIIDTIPDPVSGM